MPLTELNVILTRFCQENGEYYTSSLLKWQALT